MELKLEQLAYQKKAIESVTGLFEGQERNTVSNSSFAGIQTNYTHLSQEQIAQNIQKIIAGNGISLQDCKPSSSNDYCIEMETGTGKTLVYIRTVYELAKAYNFTKFIILVPSVAIKEGVISTLQTFGKQLIHLYNFRVDFFEYDSKKLNRLKHFISDHTPQIMIMTIQSFSSEDNILNQKNRDNSIMGLSYLEAIGKTQPVLIMDEPQEGMDTSNAIERIKVLNPLCKLRYSATHQEIKNLLFRLSPFDAYRQGLVKKIEVLSVAEKNDEASLKIEISKTEASPAKSPKVRLKLWKETKDKFEWKETPFLRDKDNLYQISGNVSYQNYTIERIYKSPADKKFHVKFTNGVEIVEGERSADFAGLFRQQLHWTIRRHFEKKEVLLTKGIKCLSLIFIDRVDNYVKKDGLIKKLFEEEYTKVYTSVKGQVPTKEHLETIQGYYFSKNTQQDYTDNEGLMKKNKEIFARILKEKEKLLSLNDPIEFIFSHSALGVGWDNPNVFNIATLNQTYSENKKRQEIGRGLRICVNQQGQRVYDPDEIKEGDEINLLTVIPNETYETFVTQYQSQISEVYGTTAAGAVTRHNHKGQKKQAEETGKLDKIFEGSMFEDFWKKISRKTDYQVAFDEARLINSAVDALNQISIPEYEVQMVRQRILSVDAHTIASEYQGSETASLKAYYSPVDMIEEIGEKTSLSYTSIVAIFNRLTNITEVIRNPHRFINEAVKLITHLELEQIAENTTYHCNGDVYDVDLLKANARTYSPSWNSDDSVNSENEMVYYLKLPDFYKIKVPLPDNSYHLDCGVVIRKQSSTNSNQDMYYFVLEAKGSHEGKSVPPINDLEKYKIRFAQKHFEALGLHTGMPIK